jgi:hypothetical protein
MDKVKILLDVDGVLNAVGYDLSHKRGWDDFADAMCNGYRIQHSQKMADALLDLDADIHWLTTWEELANEFIGPLFGWPEFPVVDSTDCREVGRYAPWWKAKAAQRFLEANPGPFVWIDDDMHYGKRSLGWLEEYPHPYLQIAPDIFNGIVPAEIEMARGFIAGVASCV